MRWIAAAMLIILAGCRGWLPTMHTDSALPQFTLRVLDGTYLDGGSARGFDYAVRSYGAQVAVDISVADAKNLKACYFELEYDAAQWNPVSAKATELLTQNGGELVELPVLSERGTVTYGAVLADYEQEQGWSGSGVVATVVFGRGEFAEKANRKATSEAQREYIGSRFPVTYDPTASEISWPYIMAGDYDQNGEVGISDLAPLARFYREHGAGDDFFWAYEDDIHAVVDGDHNGEINAADIVTIAVNLGKRFNGSNVFAQPEVSTTYPLVHTETEQSGKIGFVAYAAVTGNPANQRLRFKFSAASHVHNWLWVHNSDSSGEPTEVSYMCWASARVPGFDVYDPQGYDLKYDAPSGNLLWYYNFWFDYDQNAEVNVGDLSAVGTHLGDSVPEDVSSSLWSTDRYPNRVIGIDDWELVMPFLGYSIEGYAVFETSQEAQVPVDPFAPEVLTPLEERPVSGGGGYFNRASFSYTLTDASGKYYWVRPMYYTGNDTYAYGTRSGVVHVE